MKKITLKKDTQDTTLIPSKKGFYYFSNGDKISYAGISGNLQNRAKFFIESEEEKLDWIQEADSFSYEECDTFWDCLLQFKQFLSKNTPENQHRFRTTDQYAYLSINYSQAPFLFVRETTEKDEMYIGPFRSRFQLLDYIDNFKVLKASENAELQSVFPTEWFHFIQEWICNKPTEKIKKIEAYITKLEDELSFEKAEFWQERLHLLTQYYREFSMFISMKNLTFSWQEDNIEYVVENGMLASQKNLITQTQTSFAISNIQYNENEKLAIEKSAIDEAWIIFRHLERTKPDFYQSFLNEQWKAYREN